MQAMLTELCRDNTIFPWFLVIPALRRTSYFVYLYVLIYILKRFAEIREAGIEDTSAESIMCAQFMIMEPHVPAEK